MNDFYYEIDYEIENAFDEYGDFPLQCAALLFDQLKFYCNIVIKNQYSIKAEKTNVLSKHIENIKNYYYEWPKGPKGNYCVWLREGFLTNYEIIDILRLQGTFLSYIVPRDSFDWKKFLENWKKDAKYLLSSGQSSFICNIIDMDRTLNINFNTTVFSKEEITSILSVWEQAINHIAVSSQMRRTEMQIRSKRGNKYRVQLCFERKGRTGDGLSENNSTGFP